MNNSLPILAIAICLAVLIGWFVGIKLLTTFLVGSVSMKVATALTFIAQALASILAGKRDERAKKFALFLAMATFSTAHGSMMTRFYAMLANVEDGTYSDALFPVPSVLTAVGLMLLSISVLLWQLGKTKSWAVSWINVVVLVLGVTAMIGSVMNIPVLYGYVSEYSGGVAMPTAICMVLLSAHGILRIQNYELEQKANG